MKRLLVGFGLGSALVYGWRRLMGAEAEPEPSWQGTDNDPEDRTTMQDDLFERTRDSAPVDYESEPAAPEQAEEAAKKPRSTGRS